MSQASIHVFIPVALEQWPSTEPELGQQIIVALHCPPCVSGPHKHF